MYKYYLLIVLKYILYASIFEILYSYSNNYSAILILYYILTLNLYIADYLFRLFVPIKQINNKEFIYVNNNQDKSLSFIIHDTLHLYLKYYYLKILIYCIIYFCNNTYLNIYLYGYIHGNLFNLNNKQLSIKTICKYKPYYLLLGIINQSTLFGLKILFKNYISFIDIGSYFILFLLDYLHPYYYMVLNKLFPKWSNINFIIKILWLLISLLFKILVINKNISNNISNNLLANLYKVLLLIKNNTWLKFILWNDFASLHNLLNISFLYIFARPFFINILYYLNETYIILNYKSIQLLYTNPIFINFIIYYININNKIANIFKDKTSLSLLLNELISIISSELNKTPYINYEKFNYSCYIEKYVILENYF